MSASALASPGPIRASECRERQRATRVAGQALVLVFVILLVGLPPRLLETDRFVTTDELFWMGRSGAFARALATGQLAG
ncbi:MAG: hypothetical protein M3O34_03790, partial [Chloroflexota bacterium]|nr:hypothetical protein [Chloroflexota bacterium]